MSTSWNPANGGYGVAHGLGIVGNVTPGQVLYIRLWTMEGGSWRYVDSTYTVAN